MGLLRADVCRGTDSETARQSHATVRYANIPREYADAIARLASVAREIMVDELGLEAPDEISITVTKEAGRPVLLYTDNQDRLVLRVPTPSQLRRPQRSGIDYVYALSRELGRMSITRPTRASTCLVPAAVEGWAHYIASVLVDRLHGAVGSRLWPDEYDYLKSGTQRLDAQLASSVQPPIVRAAGLWRTLAGLLPKRGMKDCFRAIGKLKADSTDSRSIVLEPLLKMATDETAINDWWRRAAAVLFTAQATENDRPETVEPKSLSASPIVLRYDDDKGEGQETLLCGEYVVRFVAPPTPWYLTAVSFCGAGFGSASSGPPIAKIRLLDDQKRVLARLQSPYSFGRRREAQWVTMPVAPTRVPAVFFLCVEFAAGRSWEVSVQYDHDSRGHSLIGMPGGQFMPFDRGDWMIRAELDRPREFDPLSDPKLWPPATPPVSETSTKPGRRKEILAPRRP